MSITTIDTEEQEQAMSNIEAAAMMKGASMCLDEVQRGIDDLRARLVMESERIPASLESQRAAADGVHGAWEDFVLSIDADDAAERMDTLRQALSVAFPGRSWSEG